ncbi:MAG: hypothetical protein JST73_08035 [Actinobacteria bacterium]|nr:hypothetical protein [Actinomycetota bacterium]
MTVVVALVAARLWTFARLRRSSIIAYGLAAVLILPTSIPSIGSQLRRQMTPPGHQLIAGGAIVADVPIGFAPLGTIVAATVPKGATAGGLETGAIGYFGGAKGIHVVNLDGVGNAHSPYGQGWPKFCRWLVDQRLDYLVGRAEGVVSLLMQCFPASHGFRVSIVHPPKRFATFTDVMIRRLYYPR